MKFFPTMEKEKKDYLFFEVNTKNMSSHVLKISAISLVLRPREITDIFNTIDEIIFGIHLKKLNILYLSYDTAVIQWITSCHKHHKTTRVITLRRDRVTVLTTSTSTMPFLDETF